jgi:hypothetical protein
MLIQDPLPDVDDEINIRKVIVTISELSYYATTGAEVDPMVILVNGASENATASIPSLVPTSNEVIGTASVSSRILDASLGPAVDNVISVSSRQVTPTLLARGLMVNARGSTGLRCRGSRVRHILGYIGSGLNQSQVSLGPVAIRNSFDRRMHFWSKLDRFEQRQHLSQWRKMSPPALATPT